MASRRTVRRLALTLTVTVLAVVGVFTVAVFVAFLTIFDLSVIERQGAQATAAAERGVRTLRTTLLLCYVVVALVVPPVSYLVARATLSPRRPRLIDLNLPRRNRRDDSDSEDESLEMDETALTDELLLLARGSSADILDSFQVISLADIVEAVVSRQRESTTRARSIQVQVLGNPSVSGSPELLIRAVKYLVDNAMKFTSESGSVVVTVSAGSTKAMLSVRDTGRRVSADAAGHTFDDFRRVYDAQAAEGSGAGLTLVQHIAAVHRGEVSVASSPGEGTTVALTFPLLRGAQQAPASV